jgi:hypothetical protein
MTFAKNGTTHIYHFEVALCHDLHSLKFLQDIAVHQNSQEN